jgi:protein-disulfide isomerase
VASIFGERVLNIATAMATVCAVAVVGMRVKEAFFVGDANAPQHIANWRSYAKPGIVVGASNARVLIVEFSDFQCPFCRKAAIYIDSLRTARPTEVTLVYRTMPIHRYAAAAGRLARCADEQGQFWPLHMLLFTKSDSIGIKPWNRFAMEAGVADTARLNTCMASRTTAELLRADSIAAMRLGATGTPTFLINGLRVAGFPGDSTMNRYVESALRESAAPR